MTAFTVMLVQAKRCRAAFYFLYDRKWGGGNETWDVHEVF